MGGPMAGPKGQMPKGHPQVPAGNPEDAKVSYTLPKDWTKVAPNNAMIREQMTVTENGDKAEITITVLPGRGGDPLANVNRWRAQINLPKIDEEELFKSLTRIETQGLPAAMVDIANPQIPAPNRILVRHDSDAGRDVVSKKSRPRCPCRPTSRFSRRSRAVQDRELTRLCFRGSHRFMEPITIESQPALSPDGDPGHVPAPCRRRRTGPPPASPSRCRCGFSTSSRRCA